PRKLAPSKVRLPLRSTAPSADRASAAPLSRFCPLPPAPSASDESVPGNASFRLRLLRRRCQRPHDRGTGATAESGRSRAECGAEVSAEVTVAREAERRGERAQIRLSLFENRERAAESLFRQIRVEREPRAPAENAAGVEWRGAHDFRDRADRPWLL